jgi:hypothetical protein
MVDQLRHGDTVIVWKLDRLARSTRDLLETMATVRQAGARFQSLSEPWANTATHTGKLIMTVFAGIAEFDATSSGNAPAWVGKQPGGGGLTSGVLENSTPSKIKWRAGLIDEGQSVREIVDTFNVHTALSALKHGGLSAFLFCCSPNHSFN